MPSNTNTAVAPVTAVETNRTSNRKIRRGMFKAKLIGFVKSLSGRAYEAKRAKKKRPGASKRRSLRRKL
jgi:hypothetical protein